MRLVLGERLARARRLRVEERLARQQLEDEAPDGPDVRGGAKGPDPQDALGAAVLARLDVARRLRVDVKSGPQVDERDSDAAPVRALLQQHVLRLDVRVEDAHDVVDEREAPQKAPRL